MPRSHQGPTGRAQCHFISNTHWDREWRYSAQRTRHMLVHLLDTLLDIFAREPDFRSFHLDSQTLPLQDYLEIRPERREELARLVRDRRLLVGPWFCLPDEYCVDGESLVRNLLLGHRMGRALGHVSKTGYSPFSWGQISQMPQLYRGFGIPLIAFYRGVDGAKAGRSEFTWEGPDGTRILASRLSRRPRYNVWYLVQRRAFWGREAVDDREQPWAEGAHAPFRFVDAEGAEIDAQFAHPRHAYHRDLIAAGAERALAEQDGDWATDHRFWSNGHDSSCPDAREAALVADCAAALADRADVFHSTVEDWQAGVLAQAAHLRLPVARGEMRHLKTHGSTASLFGWITSARMDVKLDNFRTERALTGIAEPLCAFAALLGAPHPQAFLDTAWNWLLQNHGHDSIGGCSRDVVHEDMFFRSRQAREIASCLTERALMDIAGAVDLSAHAPDEVALVAYNPTPHCRTEVLAATIETPATWGDDGFDLVAPDGAEQRLQVLGRRDGNYTIVQCPTDVADANPNTRHQVRVELADVPGMGYRTFLLRRRRAVPARPVRATKVPRLRNEFLDVRINPDGTLTVRELATGRVYRNLGAFRDTSAVGNPWERHQVPEETEYTTRRCRARIEPLVQGALETAYRVTIDWRLPAGRSADGRRRSRRLVPYRIENTVTLRSGQPWVAVETVVDNTAEDHYLQVDFPTGAPTETVDARIPFDVVRRRVRLPRDRRYFEGAHTEQPLSSFVDRADGERGLALLVAGLKGYEARDDRAGTLSLTLLRCFPLRILVTALSMTDYSHLDQGSQCPGRHRFRYAVMPHAGDWQAAGVWQAAERFNLGLRAVQLGPTEHGRQPLERSFLEVEPAVVHVSGVKRAEDGGGWVVRLLNPTGRAVRGRLRLGGGRSGPPAQSPVERVEASWALCRGPGRRWRAVRQVTLEETPERRLAMDRDGWVALRLGRKQILTVKFEE